MIAPGEVLYGAQQPDERRGGEAGQQPDRAHQQPEAASVGRDDAAAGNIRLGVRGGADQLSATV